MRDKRFQNHELFEQRRTFRFEGIRLDRTLHREPHIIRLPRLRDIAVDVAVIDRFAEDLRVTVGGDQNSQHAGVEFTHLAKELDAFDAGHLLIRQHHRDGMLSEQLEPLLRARRGQNREVAPERQLKYPKIVLLVVDVEDRIFAVIH